MFDSRLAALSFVRDRMARLAGGAWWPPFLLFVLPFLLFRQGLGSGTPPFGGDVLALNYPLLALLKRQILHGQLPLWNNWAGGGYPLIPFSALIAYPPLWPLRVLTVTDAITVLDMAHLAIAGLGAYMLAGVTGAGRPARLVGGLAFMLSGFMIGHLYAGHLLEMGVIAWMPWVFFAAHRLIDRPGVRPALWLGLVAGLQVLANGLGFLVFTIYPVALLLLTAVVVAARQDRRQGMLLAAYSGLAGIVAVGLSGVIVLPFLQSLGWSIRAGGLAYDSASKISLLPAALLMLFSPDAVGTGPAGTYWLDQSSADVLPWHEFALYMGLMPLLAATAACLYCRRMPHVRFYVWLALAGLVLALGKYTPLYALLFHLPLVSLVRVPARWLLAGTLAVSVLAAPGFDWLLAQRGGALALWRAFRWPLLGALTLMVVLVGWLQLDYMRTGHADLQPKLFDTVFPAGGRLLLFAVILALILTCAAERLVRRSAITALLLAFTVLDLWTAESGSVLYLDTAAYYQPTPVSTLLRADAGTYRVLTLPDGPARAMPYRQGMVTADVYDAEDYAPVTMRPYWVVTHQLNLAIAGSTADAYASADARDTITCYEQRFASLLGIAKVVTSAPFTLTRVCTPGTGTPTLTLESAVVGERWSEQNGKSWNPTWFQSIAYVYRNTTALPRAFLVPESGATAQSSATAQLKTVLSPAYDSLHRLVYDPATASAPPGLGFLQDLWADVLRPASAAIPSDLGAGRARVISDTGNSVQVAVNAAQASFLVLDDMYYPGWQAWIDGKPVAIHRADYLLRAVRVPAGKHVLEFVYAPVSYLAGLLCTIGTALAVTLALTWPVLRARVRASRPVRL